MADSTINFIASFKSGAATTAARAFKHELGNLHGAASKLAGGFASLGRQLAILAVAAFGAVEEVLRRSVASADAYGFAVAKVTRLTGLSTEASSRLVAVFAKFGLEGDVAVRALGMLEKNVGNFTKSAKDAAKFQTEFGFSLLFANGKVKDANTLLLQTADYFTNKHIPATQKALFESKLYGKQWQVMIPILSLGSKGIVQAGNDAAKLGLILNKQNAGDLKNYHAATLKLGEAWGAFQLQMGLKVMPILERVFTFITGTALPAIRGITDALGRWYASAKPVIDQLTALVSGVIAAGIDTIVTAFHNLGDAGPIILGVAAAFAVLAAAISANPIAVIILSIIAIVGTLRTIWDRDLGGIREKAQWMFESFQKGYNTYLKPVVDAIGNVITTVLIPAFQVLGTVVGAVFKAMIPVIQSVIGTILVLITKIQDAIHWFADLVSMATPKGVRDQMPKVPTHRAGGGPVSAFSPYLVGERGPEMFVPNTNGTIIPHGGGSPAIVQVILDGRKVGEVMDERLYYAASRASLSAIRK